MSQLSILLKLILDHGLHGRPLEPRHLIGRGLSPLINFKLATRRPENDSGATGVWEDAPWYASVEGLRVVVERRAVLVVGWDLEKVELVVSSPHLFFPVGVVVVAVEAQESVIE